MTRLSELQRAEEIQLELFRDQVRNSRSTRYRRNVLCGVSAILALTVAFVLVLQAIHGEPVSIPSIWP
jgi:hypothetical protein